MDRDHNVILPDEAEFKMCQDGVYVKRDLECPIASVEFTSPDSLEVKRTDQVDAPPLIEIEYSLNEPRCMLGSGEPKRFMPSGEMTDYPYLNRKNMGCGGTISDPTSRKLDSTDENVVYKKNAIYDMIVTVGFMYDYWLSRIGNSMILSSYHTSGYRQVCDL